MARDGTMTRSSRRRSGAAPMLVPYKSVPQNAWAALDDILVVRYRHAPTVPMLKENDGVLIDLAKRKGSRVGMINLIDSSSGVLPDEATRAAMRTMLPGLAPYVRCIISTVEGTGFNAAAVRAVLTGMSLIASLPFPLYTVANPRSALMKMLPLLEGGKARLAELDELTVTIEGLR